MKEKKARVEDALHATRAAVEEGIIPGGGVALLRTAPALDKVKVDEEEAVGVDIMRRALDAPLRQICSNAGVEPSIVAQAVRDGKDDFGYDARSGEYVNMFKAGIIDPTKVARVAVQNATSIAGMILTTEAAVTEIPEKEAPCYASNGSRYGWNGRNDVKRVLLNSISKTSLFREVFLYLS